MLDLGKKLVQIPDVALEVVPTRSGMDKLEVYRGLGVREVWFYEAGAFQLHALRSDNYDRIEQSSLVPGLDFAVLARYVAMDDQHEAIRAYRDWLRARL